MTLDDLKKLLEKSGSYTSFSVFSDLKNAIKVVTELLGYDENKSLASYMKLKITAYYDNRIIKANEKNGTVVCNMCKGFKAIIENYDNEHGINPSLKCNVVSH